MQLRLVQQQGIDFFPLQGHGRLFDGLERAQQLQRTPQTLQQAGFVQALRQGGADHGQPPLTLHCFRWRRAGGVQLGVSGGDLLQLVHVQPGQAADGMAQFGQLPDQRQATYIGFRIQALSAGRELALGQRIAALPHPQRGHRHAQHARHRASTAQGFASGFVGRKGRRRGRLRKAHDGLR